MTALLIFSIIGLIFSLHYIMFKRRNNLKPNKFEYEPLRPYKVDPGSYYEDNESDVQKSRV